MQLNFREAGQGEPLIILHGLFGSGDNWVTVTKPLAEQFHIYVVDQRNHGRSPHDTIHSYAAMAADVIEFMDQQDLSSPIVLGHSMGGKTAMEIALNHSERVGKLIVADISPRYYKPHHQSVIAGLTAINLSQLTSRDEADKIMSQHLPQIGERQFLLKNLYRAENGSFAWRMNLEDIVRQIDNIGMENKGTPFQKPALFLKGENSNYIQGTDHELLTTLFPQYKLKTVAGAGHWIQAEKPVEFVEAVTSFLKS